MLEPLQYSKSRSRSCFVVLYFSSGGCLWSNFKINTKKKYLAVAVLLLLVVGIYGLKSLVSSTKQIGASVSPYGTSLIVVNMDETSIGSLVPGPEPSAKGSFFDWKEKTVRLEFMGIGERETLRASLGREQSPPYVVDISWADDSSVAAFRLQDRFHLFHATYKNSDLGKPRIETFNVMEENEFLSSFQWTETGDEEPNVLLLVMKRLCDEGKGASLVYGTGKGEYDRVRVVRLDGDNGKITELLSHLLPSTLPCTYHCLNAAAAYKEISPTASHVYVADSENWNIFQIEPNQDAETVAHTKKSPTPHFVQAVWWISPKQVVLGVCLFSSEVSPRFYRWDLVKQNIEEVTDQLAPNGKFDRIYTSGDLSDWIRNALL